MGQKINFWGQLEASLDKRETSWYKKGGGETLGDKRVVSRDKRETSEDFCLPFHGLCLSQKRGVYLMPEYF